MLPRLKLSIFVVKVANFILAIPLLKIMKMDCTPLKTRSLPLWMFLTPSLKGIFLNAIKTSCNLIRNSIVLCLVSNSAKLEYLILQGRFDSHFYLQTYIFAYYMMKEAFGGCMVRVTATIYLVYQRLLNNNLLAI